MHTMPRVFLDKSNVYVLVPSKNNLFVAVAASYLTAYVPKSLVSLCRFIICSVGIEVGVVAVVSFRLYLVVF